MAPLFAAVAHGCAAGRHQEALDDVYTRRISRGAKSFSTLMFGAPGVELAALSGFFHSPWRQPVATLTENAKGLVLHQAGYNLRSLGRLAEAAEPMQASLDAGTARGDQNNAARPAINLSELYLTMADLTQAMDIAQQSVDLADESGVAFLRLGSRTTLANALRQTGRATEAEALFREAEAMQKERQPGLPLLYSFQGFHYCDLLLDQGKHREARERATQTLAWANRAPEASPLDIALNHLSLGHAHLLETQEKENSDFSKAAEYLDQAVDGLRQAGTQHEIPRGHLARAALHRARRDFEPARRDLDEVMLIAERGQMGLHQADAHLEFARLCLAMGEEGEARAHLATATEMIGRMGYHRRDGEVAELEGRLAAG